MQTPQEITAERIRKADAAMAAAAAKTRKPDVVSEIDDTPKPSPLAKPQPLSEAEAARRFFSDSPFDAEPDQWSYLVVERSVETPPRMRVDLSDKSAADEFFRSVA